MRIRQLLYIVTVLGTSAPIGLAQDASSFKTLYSFTGQPDGSDPKAGVVIGQNGVLYGTTNSGGTSNYGTVFKLVPPSSLGGAWTEAVLYSFTGGYSGGAKPIAPVAIGSGGVLYGTTMDSGIVNTGNYGGGTVFALSPPATLGETWTETVLHNFLDYGALFFESSGVVVGAGGVLYGAAVAVNPPPSPGSPGPLLGMSYQQVFELNPPASPGGQWTETVLYSVGSFSTSSATVVMGKNGVLYGTIAYDNLFNVFSLTPPSSSGGSWTETDLYDFPGFSVPAAPVVIGQSGALYGTTEYGGTGSCGCGVVYSLTPPASPGGTSTETVLWSFMSGSDGALPQAGLVIGSGGVLYGTTTGGGGSNAGTVFSLTPPATVGGAWTERVLHRFTGGSDGASPLGGLVIGKNGVLYGTTSSGGASNAGTVFALEP